MHKLLKSRERAQHVEKVARSMDERKMARRGITQKRSKKTTHMAEGLRDQSGAGGLWS